MDTSKVTRVEVIDHTPARANDPIRGRVYTKWEADLKVELDFQDDGQTLKIFIK